MVFVGHEAIAEGGLDGGGAVGILSGNLLRDFVILRHIGLLLLLLGFFFGWRSRGIGVAVRLGIVLFLLLVVNTEFRHRLVDGGGCDGLLLLLRKAHGDGCTEDWPVLRELSHELGIVPVKWNVLDVAVGPVALAGSFLSTHKVSDVDLLSVDEHPIELVDGRVGRLGGLVVHVPVSLGVVGLGIGDDLAGEDVTKEREGVVELLVVNGRVEILHEDVADTGPAERGITLTPHNSARLALDHSVVHGVKGALGVCHLMEVDVGVPEGAACDGVAAHADGGDGPDRIENVEE
mmetsp:Transcript_42384/g.83272  ORF Transcript_42384/g.83272 Transcript_42384/m.83272 type:complete len:291 (-) Transcript_42384:504-1376(-)